MSENQLISVPEIRQFADVLTTMGRVYAELAKSLEENGVSNIPGVGTPTVKRAMGYLGGYTGAVLKAYAKAQAEGRLEHPSPHLLGQLAEGEAAAKHAAKPRQNHAVTEQQLRKGVKKFRAIVKRPTPEKRP